MSRWPDKYVIGLTGNIATGKSVVRKMLEHLGAYSIDADALAHRAIMPGAPGYAAVIRTFGDFILGDDGEIDRARLGRLVFADPEALALLEAIVHPLVQQGVEVLIRRSRPHVVVVEAIKLMESPLAQYYDALWVSDAPLAAQLERLMVKRRLSEADARRRIAAQNQQSEKLRAAQVVIDNGGTFENTWLQVLAAWADIAQPETPTDPAIRAVKPGQVTVTRGKPGNAAAIAEFILLATNRQRALSRSDIMAAFGEKAYHLARVGEDLVGLAGWKVENLITRVDEFYARPGMELGQVAPPLIEAVEAASQELMSEAALLFVGPSIADSSAVWQSAGYEPKQPGTLGVRVWEEAAKESMPPDSVMYFKRLRTDRVLSPV